MRSSRQNNKLSLVALLLGCMLPCLSGSCAALSFDDSEIKHISYPDWFAEHPFSDLADELSSAQSGGKQGLMVLFTTEGCSYCDRFIRESLGELELASLVQQHFASVGMEIFDDTEMTDPRGVPMTVRQFADREGADFSPTLLFYSHDGERILRVAGYQSPARFRLILAYLTGEHFRTESLGDYFARHAEAEKQPAAHSSAGLRPDPLFGKPPYALDRSRFRASQPLLVIFEQTDCPECEDFHTAVLAAREVREVLKRFEIVRLDAADTKTPVIAPDGSRVTPALWFMQAAFTRAPALAFFDEQGSLVLKTDALVLRQRMMNSLFYVLERAYEKGWSYQRFARSRAIERRQKQPDQSAD